MFNIATRNPHNTQQNFTRDDIYQGISNLIKKIEICVESNI